MSDLRSFERSLASRMEAERRGAQLPDTFYDDFRFAASGRRQRPRWLALIKEPPMRVSSSLAVGSPTARVMAVMVATLLLALLTVAAGIAGTRLLAADDPIVIAQDGSGDVTTIAEGVAMAHDGDTVLVRPGTYVEAVIIERDITLAGDGTVADITMEAPEGGPTAKVGDLPNPRPEASYALLLIDTDATVAGLTLRGEPSRVHVAGGAPRLEALVFEGVGRPVWAGGDLYGGVAVSDGSRVAVVGNTFHGGGGIQAFDDSEPLIEANALWEGAAIIGSLGDRSVIRDNEIGGPGTGGGIGIRPPSTALVEGNVVTGAAYGIWVEGSLSGEIAGPVFRGNSVSGSASAIEVGKGVAATIEDNELSDNRTGIFLSKTGATRVTGNELRDNAIGIGVHESEALIEDNAVRGGTTGVIVTGEAAAQLLENTVEGASQVGIRVGRGASPTLRGNRICDNVTNLVVDEGASPVIEDNDICPDALAAD